MSATITPSSRADTFKGLSASYRDNTHLSDLLRVHPTQVLLDLLLGNGRPWKTNQDEVAESIFKVQVQAAPTQMYFRSGPDVARERLARLEKPADLGEALSRSQRRALSAAPWADAIGEGTGTRDALRTLAAQRPLESDVLETADLALQLAHS